MVAPAGPFERAPFDAGVRWLRERYEVTHGPGIYGRTGYFAGDDERRLAELREAIEDPEVDAILCARGGYGAARLLPRLDLSAVRQANKLIIGFSDATALHSLWARAGVRSIHAPMAAGLGKASDTVRKRWIDAVENQANRLGKAFPPNAAGFRGNAEALVPGEMRGRLAGGNLAVLHSLLGTPWFPPLGGTVLFLEDVGERPYRVDRMLTSLSLAGWLDRVAGIVLGQFTEGEPGPDGVSLDAVLEERLGGLGVPVLRGFPAGHVEHNEALVFGEEVRVTTAPAPSGQRD